VSPAGTARWARGSELTYRARLKAQAETSACAATCSPRAQGSPSDWAWAARPGIAAASTGPKTSASNPQASSRSTGRGHSGLWQPPANRPLGQSSTRLLATLPPRSTHTRRPSSTTS